MFSLVCWPFFAHTHSEFANNSNLLFWFRNLINSPIQKHFLNVEIKTIRRWCSEWAVARSDASTKMSYMHFSTRLPFHLSPDWNLFSASRKPYRTIIHTNCKIVLYLSRVYHSWNEYSSSCVWVCLPLLLLVSERLRVRCRWKFQTEFQSKATIFT